jgi:hypothetical protein
MPAIDEIKRFADTYLKAHDDPGETFVFAVEANIAQVAEKIAPKLDALVKAEKDRHALGYRFQGAKYSAPANRMADPEVSPNDPPAVVEAKKKSNKASWEVTAQRSR